ncbi:MAG: hypothetical protein K2X64_04970 [Rhodocyclaceae bacterium]|nr:hypothetical protein [Rhodocyclaceae bacterium]
MLAVLCGSAVAQVPTHHVVAKASDPFDLCASVVNRLPPTLAELRPVLEAVSETPEGGTFPCGSSTCRVHRFIGKGYAARFLVVTPRDEVTPIEIRVDSPRWRLLTPLRVGMPVSVAEQYFGVSLPGASGQAEIEGVCSQLTVDYQARQISALHLQCRPCESMTAETPPN